MNKVILMGRLVRDPELRYTSQNNVPVVSFTLAVDKYTKGDEKAADFIACIAWNKLAENIEKYLEKGRRIVIYGKIQTRTWEDSEGKKHYVTEVVADEMHFADDKKKDSQSSSQGQPQVGDIPPWKNNSGEDELPF